MYDGPIWTTGRNRYDTNQWTLVIELRGSMLVYFTLVVTADFTPFCRNTVFFVLLLYFLYSGDLMAEIPFYIGALLADLSLVLQSESLCTSPPSSKFKYVRKYWPICLAIFALYLSSYPTNHAELAAWSRFMTRLGEQYFHPNCPYVLVVS
jgi:hypothetical protein